MKHVIANRDIDDPNEFKEIAPVELDLAAMEEVTDPTAPDFSDVIALAVAGEQAKLQAEREREKRRDAQALAAARFRAVAEEIKQATGVAIGFSDPFAYKPKSKAAYSLWKRVVPSFIEDPRTLDIGPTALAQRLAANEPNYTVTRDMIYAKLNKFAVNDVNRLLRRMGVTLKLKTPVTIRSIQKDLKARRDASIKSDSEAFAGRFEIKGEMAYVNGKGYKIQLNASGKRRIKRGGKEWLPLDTLKAFCTEE